jgi:hypothetical protein
MARIRTIDRNEATGKAKELLVRLRGLSAHPTLGLNARVSGAPSRPNRRYRPGMCRAIGLKTEPYFVTEQR